MIVTRAMIRAGALIDPWSALPCAALIIGADHWPPLEAELALHLPGVEFAASIRRRTVGAETPGRAAV